MTLRVQPIMGFLKDWLKDIFWRTVYIPWNQHLRIRYFIIRSIIYKVNFIVPVKRLNQT